MIRVDLQTHTNQSAGCGWMAPETLVRRAAAVGLDGVAITDHNTMDAVAAARRIAPDDLLVIPAEEIDTPEGQIIGLFLDHPIEPWQSPSAVFDAIHRQDGLALLPHPFDAMREHLETIGDHVDSIDAVETINSRCIRSRYNERASAFAERHGLTKTGGSDAHFARELGTAHTRIEGDASSPERLATIVREAIADGRTHPVGSTGTPLVHVGTKAVKMYNRVRNR